MVEVANLANQNEVASDFVTNKYILRHKTLNKIPTMTTDYLDHHDCLDFHDPLDYHDHSDYHNHLDYHDNYEYHDNLGYHDHLD